MRDINWKKAKFFRRCQVNPITGCWIWKGSIVLPSMYGLASITDPTKPKRTGGKSGMLQTTAHRIAAHLWLNFDLHSKLLVCHKCDVRLCCNPDHLFVGTQQENITDMWRKGRGPNQHHPHKLTANAVKQIRYEYSSGKWTHRSLACKWRVGKSIIGEVVRRKAWAHI